VHKARREGREEKSAGKDSDNNKDDNSKELSPSLLYKTKARTRKSL
jgi:hypothetical protein